MDRLSDDEIRAMLEASDRWAKPPLRFTPRGIVDAAGGMVAAGPLFAASPDLARELLESRAEVARLEKRRYEMCSCVAALDDREEGRWGYGPEPSCPDCGGSGATLVPDED